MFYQKHVHVGASTRLKAFFERIVWQCVEAGLIDGSKIFTDASLVQADASNNSVVNQDSLKRYLNKSYRELEKRLEDEHDIEIKKGKANRKYISSFDLFPGKREL